MNVFDLLSNEKDNEVEEDAKLLKRTKEWLKEAGFPQYVQMYNDGEMPISLKNVQEDHADFDGEALMALFRRIEILNRSVATAEEPTTLTRPIKSTRSVTKAPHFQIIDDDDDDKGSIETRDSVDKMPLTSDSVDAPASESYIEQLVTKQTDEEDEDSSDDDDDDDKENILGHTALSRKWFYEPHIRRWSHVEPTNNLVPDSNQKNTTDNKSHSTNNKTLQSYLGSLLPKPYHRQQHQQNRASKSSDKSISNNQSDQVNTNVNNHKQSSNKSSGFKVIQAVSRFNPNQFSFKTNSNSATKEKSKKPADVAVHEDQSNMNIKPITTSQPNFLNNSQISPFPNLIQRPASVNVTNTETLNTVFDPVLDLLESDVRSLDVFRARIYHKSSPEKSSNSPANSISSAVRPQSLLLSPQAQQPFYPSSTKSTPSSKPENKKSKDTSSLHPATDTEDNAPTETENRTIGRNNYLSKSFSLRKSGTIDYKKFHRFEPLRWSHSIQRNVTDKSAYDGHNNTTGVLYENQVIGNLFNLSCMTVNDMNYLNQKSLLDCTAQIEKHLPNSQNAAQKSFFNWKLPKIRSSNRKKKSTNNLPPFPDGVSPNNTSTSSSPTSSNSVPCYPPVFGVNLASHQTRYGYPYPPALDLIFDYLYQHVPTSQGVFRKTGMKLRINQLKQEIDINPYVGNFQDYTVHDIGDTLKCFYRELPIRLFDLKISNTLMTLYNCVPQLERLDKLKWTLYTLADENRIALHKLLKFLSYISQFSEETKMDSKNLSLCFGPSLFTFQSELDLYSSSSSSGTYPNYSTSTHASFRLKRSATNNNLGAGPNSKHLSEQNAAHLCMVDLITHYEQLFTVTDSLVLDIKSKPRSKWEPISLEQMFEPIIWQGWIQDKIRGLFQEAVGSSSSSNHNSKASNTLSSPPVHSNGNQSNKNSINMSFRHDSGSSHTSPTAPSNTTTTSVTNNNHVSLSWSQIHKETMKRTIAHIRWQLPKYFRNNKTNESDCRIDYFDYFKHPSYSSSQDNMLPNELTLSFKKIDDHGDNIALRTWKATIEIEAKPGVVFSAIKNHRELWDTLIEEVSVLDEVNEYSELIRLRLFNPDHHISQRIAYVLRSHQLGLGGSGNILVSESVSSVINHTGSCNEEVGSTVFRDDFFIEACHDFGSRVTWVCRIDLGGFHANWYASYWGARMLGSLCALRRCLLWGGDLSEQFQKYRTLVLKQQQNSPKEPAVSPQQIDEERTLDISPEDFQLARETDL